jgi:hypothetical protein
MMGGDEVGRARALAWEGRPHEALSALACGPEASGPGDADLLALRAGLLAVSGQTYRALREVSALPADRGAAALGGRLLDAVAAGAPGPSVERMAERLAFLRAGGVPAEVMRLGLLLAACRLDLGRVGEARAGLETVARESAAAGVPGVGLLARAVHAAAFATSAADRQAATGDLGVALESADPETDPLSFAVGSAVRARLLASLHLDAEAREVAARATAVLTELLGATGARIGRAIATVCRPA